MILGCKVPMAESLKEVPQRENLDSKWLKMGHLNLVHCLTCGLHHDLDFDNKDGDVFKLSANSTLIFRNCCVFWQENRVRSIATKPGVLIPRRAAHCPRLVCEPSGGFGCYEREWNCVCGCTLRAGLITKIVLANTIWTCKQEINQWKEQPKQSTSLSFALSSCKSKPPSSSQSWKSGPLPSNCTFKVLPRIHRPRRDCQRMLRFHQELTTAVLFMDFEQLLVMKFLARQRKTFLGVWWQCLRWMGKLTQADTTKVQSWHASTFW